MRDLLNASFQLALEAGGLGRSLNAPVRRAVGDLVRSMNCYYSNLIEGHDTLPHDIERAMRNDYSAEATKRNLQLEARAHIEVQAMIDHGELDYLGFGQEFVRALHREFCVRLPDELLWVTDQNTGMKYRINPGEWRERGVIVGDHVAINADLVPGFMAHFEWGYSPRRVGQAYAAIAAAAAHHRLLWIHPFLDGNGRVARLYSHAYLRQGGVGSDLWSVSRGLARTVGRYKEALARADAPPQSMTDGRGTLSDGRLCDFITLFIETCRDQVNFMGHLLEPGGFLDRLDTFVSAEAARTTLDRRVLPLLERAFMTGEVQKNEVADLLGVTDRHARRLIEPLIKRGLLVTENKLAPYRLAFPLTESDLLFPRLFAPPEAARPMHG